MLNYKQSVGTEPAYITKLTNDRKKHKKRQQPNKPQDKKKTSLSKKKKDFL